jgi:hypothetical protein
MLYPREREKERDRREPVPRQLIAIVGEGSNSKEERNDPDVIGSHVRYVLADSLFFEGFANSFRGENKKVEGKPKKGNRKQPSIIEVKVLILNNEHKQDAS